MKSILYAIVNTLRSIAKSKTTYLILVILGVIFLASRLAQFNYSDFALTYPSGKVESVKFPAFAQSFESGVYKLNGTIEMGRFASTRVRIVPDDEILALTINKMPVDLSGVPYQERRDYTKGFIYDLKPYLHAGKNEAEIVYSDQGGLMGVVFSSLGDAWFNNIIYGLLSLIGLLLAHKFYTLTRFKTSIKILFLAGLFIRILYFAATPPDVRDHDLGDHTGYIEYLAEHWVPPPVEQAMGGAYFHPPLYYYTGAIVYKVSQVFLPNNKFAIFRVEQALSLVYSMGFVLFGLLILNHLIPEQKKEPSLAKPYQPFRASFNHRQAHHKKQSTIQSDSHSMRALFNTYGLFWVICALFVFWPSAVIHSVRIGNDPLEYFLFTASLFYICCWYSDDKKRDLIIASLVAAAAIVTKANGEILIVVLGIVGLYKMIKSKQYANYSKLAIVPGFILFVAVAITATPALLLMHEGKRTNVYIANITEVSSANVVGNTAANFFWFDAKIFLTEPYPDPYDDRMGRQFFWNYLGKTSLFGEFRYPKLIQANLAIFSSFLEILMFVYVVFGIYTLSKNDFKRLAPVLLSGFFLWFGITYMRVTYPVNIDFRYIVPILVTFCALYSVTIQNFQKSGALRLANIGITMALLFTASGIIFIFSLLS
jgi:hypothetical protein